MDARIPDLLQFQFVLPPVFVSFLFISLEDRPTRAAAAVVAWRTENILLTIAVGMTTLWLLSLVL